jgi:carboxymethylenebutenolidase
MRSLEALPQNVREQIRDHMRDLTDAMIVKDAQSILEFLSSEPTAGAGPKGVIGYCMGGRHALAVAGHYPEQFTATVSLHGTRLVLDTPNSVHRLAGKFRGAMYCGFAERDELAPPATVKTLADTLGSLPGLKYEYLVHPGTIHGYSLPDRDIYDKQAANRDWERIFSLFHGLQP